MAKKGCKKPPGSGRKKGTLNKASLPARELAERMKVSPLEILLRFAMGDWEGLGYPKATETRQNALGGTYEVPVITPQMRMYAATEATQYIAPRLKNIEVTDPDAANKKPLIVYETTWRELEADDAEGDT